MNKKSFDEIFEEFSRKPKGPNGHTYGSIEDEEEEEFVDDEMLTDTLDHEIVMHRDAHFGGDFGIMLKYYQEEGIGVNPDFDIERIEYLAKVESELGQNLGALLLDGSEAEKVGRATRAYRQLKAIYEKEKLPDSNAALLADLILSEEEEPEKEIEKIVARGESIVPDLLQIVKSEEAYDTLFPGYGLAPALAIHCLGLIKDERAIIPLFEALGNQNFFEEEVILSALYSIGEKAKIFLLKVLKGRPLNNDNENAAFALTCFGGDEEVSKAALKELQDPAVVKNETLVVYLLNCCEGLKENSDRAVFKNLENNPTFSSEIREEIKHISRQWEKSV